MKPFHHFWQTTIWCYYWHHDSSPPPQVSQRNSLLLNPRKRQSASPTGQTTNKITAAARRQLNTGRINTSPHYTVQTRLTMAAFTEPHKAFLCGCKVRAHWPLCGAPPVRPQIFSSVIESDGWVVLASYGDVWTTARNPNLHRGRGGRGPCYIVSCEGHLDSKGKSSPNGALMRNQRTKCTKTPQDNCCPRWWLYKVQGNRATLDHLKENVLLRWSLIKWFHSLVESCL